MDFDNGGATYAIALSLVVLRDKSILQRLSGESDVEIIDYWHSGPAGGLGEQHASPWRPGAHYQLRDVERGVLVAKSDGPLSDKSPAWTRGLWDEDAQ